MSNKNVKDNEYLGLSAAIRAREAKMPPREALERMLDSADFAESARICAEYGYPDMSGMDINGINDVLSAHFAEALDDVEKAAPEKCVTDAFRIKYDYHNAKVMIKSRAANVDGERLLSAAGRVSPEKIMNAFNEDDYSDLPGDMAEAMQQARGILARSANPQLCDVSLDKAYFAELHRLAQEESSGFLAGYAELMTDSANLRTFVRTARMGKGAEFLRSVLVPGGSVDIDTIVQARLTNEGPEDVFGNTALAGCAAAGAGVMESGSLTEFERGCDNAVTDYLRDAKLRSFGPEPVIAYLAALEQEETSLRMILTGKLSGISPDTIRERLRETYA